MNTPKPPQATSLSGLDPAEAARRLAEHGPNLSPGSAPKSVFTIVISVLVEPMADRGLRVLAVVRGA